ncbi:hypothetical protein SFRURICE_011080, partial [Spodoptera frugiperda]
MNVVLLILLQISRLLGNRGLGRGVINWVTFTQRKRCLTSVYCSAVVSLRSSRPSSAEAWLSHTSPLTFQTFAIFGVKNLKIVEESGIRKIRKAINWATTYVGNWTVAAGFVRTSDLVYKISSKLSWGKPVNGDGPPNVKQSALLMDKIFWGKEFEDCWEFGDLGDYFFCGITNQLM